MSNARHWRKLIFVYGHDLTTILGRGKAIDVWSEVRREENMEKTRSEDTMKLLGVIYNQKLRVEHVQQAA
ncbi:unnamed protein product [Penicillium camemberti]|uniref:Str. FM013 n=1 Tax=Penicillium camemberti (strain FM 013) TaxID=1429867 RepID=A0A0G4PV79_PENC3|nr:unnamed protein product [Penicillium camemberti]